MSENPNGTGRGRQVGDPFVPEEPTQAVRDFFGPAFAEVAEYARMLEEEGEIRGLLGPRDMERIWSRHIVNSAAVLDFMPRKDGRQVLDVGSGSGLPGIVIAACRPELDVHLAEPMARRVEWLMDVVEDLGLDNVTIHQARAEELRGKGKADVVTARAVANMSKLVRMTSKVIAPGGSWPSRVAARPSRWTRPRRSCAVTTCALRSTRCPPSWRTSPRTWSSARASSNASLSGGGGRRGSCCGAPFI